MLAPVLPAVEVDENNENGAALQAGGWRRGATTTALQEPAQETVSFFHLAEWVHHRLGGDPFAKAILANIATWPEARIEGWQVDFYNVIVDVTWRDRRDGAVYGFMYCEASVLTLTASRQILSP